VSADEQPAQGERRTGAGERDAQAQARERAARADAAQADDASDLIGDARRRVRVGTIELIVATIVLLALIALAVWFFGFAHNPCCSR